MVGITTTSSTWRPGVTERMRADQLAVVPDFPARIIGLPDPPAHGRRDARTQLREEEPRRILFARRDGQHVGFTGRAPAQWENAARPAPSWSATAWLALLPGSRSCARRGLDLMVTTQAGNVGVDDLVAG